MGKSVQNFTFADITDKTLGAAWMPDQHPIYIIYYNRDAGPGPTQESGQDSRGQSSKKNTPSMASETDPASLLFQTHT